MTAPLELFRFTLMYLSAACARQVFQVLMGTLVLTSSSSTSGVLLQRFSPARPHQVPRQQSPPGESRTQAGKKKCNQQKGELLFLVEIFKNRHLGRLEHSGTTSAKYEEPSWGAPREENCEREDKSSSLSTCGLSAVCPAKHSTLTSELDNFGISLRISIDEGQIISCQHLTSFPKTASSVHSYTT